MKRVLITGLNSYIGNSFVQWAGEGIETTKVSLKPADWQAKSWEGYDAVLHVAGLAHVDVKHADEATRQRYYAVNRDLTIAAADKARRDGVGQFIYMSSIIIYGDSAPIGQEKVITVKTEPSPANFYGDSKWQAEKGILPLETENFHIVIIRTPMVFGEGSKGNFPKLVKLAQKLPGGISVFPEAGNHRSMIHIRNLCELIRILILQQERGVFYPQNKEQLSTGELYQMIRTQLGRKTTLQKGWTPLLKTASRLSGYVDKLFGSLTYAPGISAQELGYCRYTAQDAIALSVTSYRDGGDGTAERSDR